MSYDSDWNTVYECVPEGDYTVCVDFGGSDYGYFYFGDMYFDAWNIYYNDGDSCQDAGGACDDTSYEYQINYGSPCSGGEYTFTLTDSATGDIVWQETDENCGWSNETICLPYGDYEACVSPEFGNNGGYFEVAYVPEWGYNVWIVQLNGWNNDSESCSELDVPNPDGVSGCTDPLACNYNIEANTDDGSCTYAVENYDCDGNCIISVDCNGECGGDSVEDNCGTCDNDSSNECIEDCAGVWGGDS